jgi:hypothetical protein
MGRHAQRPEHRLEGRRRRARGPHLHRRAAAVLEQPPHRPQEPALAAPGPAPDDDDGVAPAAVRLGEPPQGGAHLAGPPGEGRLREGRPAVLGAVHRVAGLESLVDGLDDLGRRLEARRRVAREQPAQQRREGRGSLLARAPLHLREGVVAAEQGVQHRPGVGGRLPRQHEVEDRAEGVEVRPVVRCPLEKHLGRQESQGAGEGLRHPAGVPLREPQVHQDRRPAPRRPGDDHVARLEVPVDEAAGVEGAEAPGAAHEDAEDVGAGQRAAPRGLLERLPLDAVHGDGGGPARRVEERVAEAHHVGVGERPEVLRLAAQVLAHALGDGAVDQHLEDALVASLRVPSDPRRSRAAGADPLEEREAGAERRREERLVHVRPPEEGSPQPPSRSEVYAGAPA